MIYGYARVSTDKQDHLRQKEILKDCGINKMFYEIVSGGKEAKKRPVFSEMYKQLKEGDIIYFAEMSRMGRSTIDLLDTVKDLVENKKVSIVFLKEGLRMGNAFGENSALTELIFHIMASVSEFERQLIRQRSIDGLKAANAEGRFGGRPKDKNKEKEVADLLYKGEYTQGEIAELCGVSQPYVSLLKKKLTKANLEAEDIYEI